MSDSSISMDLKRNPVTVTKYVFIILYCEGMISSHWLLLREKIKQSDLLKIFWIKMMMMKFRIHDFHLMLNIYTLCYRTSLTKIKYLLNKTNNSNKNYFVNIRWSSVLFLTNTNKTPKWRISQKICLLIQNYLIKQSNNSKKINQNKNMKEKS